MKSIVIVALLFAAKSAKAAPYFDNLARDPQHPKVSASALYTPRMQPDGAVSNVALVWHKADPADCLWPAALLNAGFPPISWTLLEVGGGGNTRSGFADFGAGVNVAPTLLGPLTAAMNRAGGNWKAAGSLISNPNGSGLKVGVDWKSSVVSNGGLLRFNQMRLNDRLSFGYAYQF